MDDEAKVDLVSQDFYLLNDDVLAMVGGADLTDAHTGKQLLKLEASNSKQSDWILYTPDGAYSASPIA